MRNLTAIDIPLCLNSSENDLSKEFFIPCLQHSVGYDRGVGYFSSGWLRINAIGLQEFALHGGKARWITSPILSKIDWEALKKGEEASTDEFLKAALARNIDELEQDLSKDMLNTLAWLIADGILEFRLAVPRNSLDGEFHDKFGIFKDSEGNQLSFTGSVNESIQGTRNYESISTFRSWVDSQKVYLNNQTDRFERLWNNEDLNLRTYPIDEANKAKIIKLRQLDRPYAFEEPKPNYQADIIKIRQPEIPDYIELRDYQQQAIDNWFEKDCRGIFKMATGTGKTITALAALVRLLDEEKRLLVLISCPFIHLAQQWIEEAIEFGFSPILIGESRKKWENETSRLIQLFKRKKKNRGIFVTTNTSFTSSTVQDLFADVWKDTVVVFDEAHYAGSTTIRENLPEKAPYRLGLSATIERHRDTLGTAAIFDYFGQVVFDLPIEDVIGKYLTKYLYYPIPVELTEEEFEEYCQLTTKISKYYRSGKESLQERANKLAIERARIINNSVNKLEWLKENLEEAEFDYSLFYAGERIFDEVKLILSNRHNVRLHEFTSRQSPKKRKQLLKQFSIGELQSLVAMKCLDEGIDVPPTRVAYFLASSGNPREFVQRRGRILRKYEGKHRALIYDLISIPPKSFIEQGTKGEEYASVKSTLIRELKRIKAFSKMAENRYSSLDELLPIINQLELLDQIN